MKRIIKSLMTILVMAGLLLTNVHMISAADYASDTYETTIYYESYKYNRAADIQVIAEWLYVAGTSVVGAVDDTYREVTAYDFENVNASCRTHDDVLNGIYSYITEISVDNGVRLVTAVVYQDCDIYGQVESDAIITYSFVP